MDGFVLIIHKALLIYVLYFFQVWPAPENDEPDDRMAMEIWRLWAQFAKHGNPSSDWKPCSLEKPVYFDLKIPTKLKKHLPDDNIRFWDSCLKKTKTGQNSKL